MGKKKKNPAPEAGTKAGSVTVKFTRQAFRYKGVEYKSADVQKAAEEGDEDALAIIANLVQKGSGVIQVTGEEGGTPNE